MTENIKNGVTEEVGLEKDVQPSESGGSEQGVTETARPTTEVPTKIPTQTSLQQKINRALLRFFKNPWNWAFLVLFALILYTRLKYIDMESLWNDAAVHLWYAVKVLKEPSFLFTSKYLLGDYAVPQTITALLSLFTENVFIAGKITAVLFSMTGVVVIYLLGTKLHSRMLGLLSAALFGFNHLLWFYGIRPLADSPLTVMLAIVFYCIIRLEAETDKQKKWALGWWTAVFFLVAILTKKQAVVFLLAYILYLIIWQRKILLKDKAVLVSWTGPVAVLLLGSIIFRSTALYSLLERVIKGYGLQDGSMLNVYNHLQWIFSWYLLIPILLGLLFVLLYRKKEYYFLAFSFLFYLIYMEIGVATIEDRIVLPVFVPAVFLAVFALLEVGKYIDLLAKKKHIGILLVILFTIFVCWQAYQTGDILVEGKTNSYLGHAEAGRWIQENVPENTPLFAGSPRMVRVFTERDFGGPGEWMQGGSIWYLRSEKYLQSRDAFEQDVHLLAKQSDVYLEIDIWEYTQPRWYFPLRQESIDYFVSQGFIPVKVVEREVETDQGKMKLPVIFILKKDKE